MEFGQKAVLCKITVLGNSILVFTVAAPVHIPTSLIGLFGLYIYVLGYIYIHSIGLYIYVYITKEAKDLYFENCRTFKKEIEDTNGNISMFINWKN